MNMDEKSNQKTEGVLETIVLVICFSLSLKSFWIVLSIVSLSLHWDYLRYVFYHRRCYCNQRWMLKSLCGSIKTSIKLNKIHIFKVCDPCLIAKSKLKKHSAVMLLLQRIHFTKNPNNIISSQRNVLRILYSLLKAKTIVATLLPRLWLTCKLQVARKASKASQVSCGGLSAHLLLLLLQMLLTRDF